ncbi:glycogen synthase GlgA [Clostridium sp. 'White wine YQ']|uniref:glycogen synthase GlgA n=1 Tax=Clostridium sp. 'White wine YQ' TaxID=3027474 RepID=UPI0023650698|nr:glycogen synthase GlgA [Clostridium sp. 'White wine YQ']MDD7796429.1 glycogen synthase GlgA [Clostridium sp. 'White wine YQ']
MKVLFVTSEAEPFAKTGGLGDVAGSLPRDLKNLDVDVSVIMPYYKEIKEKYNDKLYFIKCFTVSVGWRSQYCGLFQYEFEGVKYYFIDNERYFDRDGLYGYYDDAERFAFFDRAVLQTLKEIDLKVEIIHANDWQSGMIPVLLKLEYSKDPFYSQIKTVFSIHNLLFRGTYDPNILPELFGYDMVPYEDGSLEFYGGVSFMKGGINYSDRVSTVSPSYAGEIQTSLYGEGLDGLLRSRSSALSGILNGIDYKAYNPEKDEYIYQNYSVRDLDGKSINKEKLQEELGLPINKEIPLIGIVSRLTNQKGMNLVAEVSDSLLQKEVQLVVLGTGDYLYEEHFKNLQYRYPNKVSANIRFSNELAHKIYAACDMFLMPSLFEPCGLGQLIALRYGTIPIVRETGGLKDTVIPYNKYNGEGNGFSFKNYSAWELMNTIEYALYCYGNNDVWGNLVISAMNQDNSWRKSAEDYKNLYLNLVTQF